MELTQPCPVVERCGGCPLLLRTGTDEHSIKLAALQQLHMTTRLSNSRPELVAGKSRVGYRNRIRLRIDESGQIAFFNSEKSSECAVLLPELRQYVARLRDWSNVHRAALVPFAHLEARASDCNGNFGLFLTYQPTLTAPESKINDIAPSFANQCVATNLDATVPHQRFDIDGATVQYVPLDGFLQVNFEVNRLLTEHVVRGAIARDLCDFADLYCGSGNFALPLARARLLGQGVERVASCRTAAVQAAREQGLDGVTFSEGDSIDAAARWLANGQRFDLVVVDPPRAGIRYGLDHVAMLAKRCIVYCSCNPVSLLRDLGVLRQAGWHVDQLTGFDLFPGTIHLEVVAWLSRMR